MKNIDGEKLWAYLDAKFEEFGEEYERQSGNVAAGNATATLCKMRGEMEKRNFIIKFKNEILSGKLDA